MLEPSQEDHNVTKQRTQHQIQKQDQERYPLAHRNAYGTQHKAQENH